MAKINQETGKVYLGVNCYGTTLPSTCYAGDTFVKTDGSSGQQLYACTASNVWVLQGGGGPGGEAFPVGALYLSVTGVNPTTELGYGTWSGFGAGRVLIGRDAGDTDFDTAEETGGAKTVAATGSNSAPAISGSTAAEASHTHSVTSNVSVDDHASHTHTYTQVVNHTHSVTELRGASTGGATTSASGLTSGNDTSSTAVSFSTGNPSGGVATGTTAGPSATLTHTANNPAVTSGGGSSHSHGVGTLAASAPTFTGSATSVVQPYIVVYMWKRTA